MNFIKSIDRSDKYFRLSLQTKLDFLDLDSFISNRFLDDYTGFGYKCPLEATQSNEDQSQITVSERSYTSTIFRNCVLLR